jgi:selenide,water dikinase
MNTADDAGIYRLDRDRALVVTVDYFMPIVDDPFTYGQIAAANALSDVYAMGGRPLTALNILGFPEDAVPPAVIGRILRGGAAKAKEAHCTLAGGHTIKSSEPFYGLSVTGLVNPRRLITNAAARPGDTLTLTKPLGTGIVTTAMKRGACPTALARQAVRSMGALNSIGAELAERGLVRSGTDVTGFGLLGHLGSLCRASRVGAEIRASALPVIGLGVWDLIAADCVPGGTRKNLETAVAWTRFAPGVTDAQKLLAADAQTSGGLLLCVAQRQRRAVLQLLARRGTICAAEIGVITANPRGTIRVLP